MNNANRNGKNTLLLLTGAIVGAAATYYLQTPKGKQLIKTAQDKSQEIGESMKSKAQVLAEEATTKTNKAIETANSNIAIAKELLAENTVAVLDKAETKVGGFQEGINKAKKLIVNNSNAS